MEIIDSFRGPYYFLSNFYLSEMLINGRLWASVEHAFQAAKSEDPVDQERIRNVPTSADAKRMGGAIRLRPDWDEIKYDIMVDCLREKFKQNPDLAQRLINTGSALLVEGNWWHDNTWGVCRCGCSRGRNVGRNWLGIALMLVRSELIDERRAA